MDNDSTTNKDRHLTVFKINVLLLLQLLPLFYLKMLLIQKKTYFLQTYYGDSIRRIANYMYIYNMYAFFAITFV